MTFFHSTTMKIFLTILLLLIFSICAFSQSQDTIYWSTCYKLKWDDFLSTPDNNSKFKAVSSVGINYRLTHDEKSFAYSITCTFNRKKSWSKSTDSTLLGHENTHFNITELFARKLNQAFKNYKMNVPATIQNDFKKIAMLIRSQRDSMDNLYDKETNFSINKKKQLFWDKKIAKELKLLEAYK